MRNIYLSLAILAALAPWARADLIDLKDGRHLSGTIARQGDAMVITAEDGAIVTARPEEVGRVTLTGAVSPAQAAGAEWTRISSQIKGAENLQAIISLDQAYLDKFPDAENAGEVKASMKHYQALAASGAVKFRGRWVARADIDLILHKWATAAKPGEELYRAGKMKEALDAAKGALDADKENPDALTIAGLAAYRVGNLPAARNYFASLAASDSGSVLAENNLAVVSFGQKQAGEGIFHYGKALQIAPENRLLLDNVVEAMSAYLAGGDKNADTFKAMQRQFDVAEKKMEELMAAKGLVRRGSTWIDRATADQMAQREAAIRGQLAAMTGQLAAIQGTLTQLDVQIRQVSDDYNAAVTATVVDNTAIAGADPRRDDIGAMMAARELAVQNATHADLLRREYQMQRDKAVAAARDLAGRSDQLQTALNAVAAPLFGAQRIMEMGEGENPPPPAPVAPGT